MKILRRKAKLKQNKKQKKKKLGNVLLIVFVDFVPYFVLLRASIGLFSPNLPVT